MIEFLIELPDEFLVTDKNSKAKESKQPVNFTYCHKSMFNKQLVRAPTWIYSIKNYFVNKEQKFHLTIHFESFLDKFGQFKAIITEVGSNEQSHSPSDFVNS